MPTLLEKRIANPKQLFFVDGLGAWLTAFLLSVVLSNFESTFGMPLHILIVLALIAGFFAFYSFGCYFFLKHKWKPYLLAIAVANLLYCALTLGLVIRHYEELTFWGLGYFIVELLVLIVLIVFEFRTTLKKQHISL